MKTTKAKVIGVVILFMCDGALAYNYGKWFCDDCAFNTVGTPANLNDPVDAITFIKTHNNDIMNSGPFKNKTTARWIEGDVITVCDGKACLLVVYRLGSWFPVGGTLPDIKDYKNVGNLPGVQGGDRDFVVAATVFNSFPSGGDALIVLQQLTALPYYEATGTVTVGELVVVGTVSDFAGFPGNGNWGSDFPLFLFEPPDQEVGNCKYRGCAMK